MAKYKKTDKGQGLFLTVNLEKQLDIGTFEWTLNYIIDNTDMSLFDKQYHNDKVGARAYSPKILLKIIIFCYSRGVITSRKIERMCQENVVLKALSENSEPDHDTIAHFISTNSEAIRDLFTQVLFKCSELKLIRGEMFAVDGCKLPSNASKSCSGKIEKMKERRDKIEKHIEKIIKRHEELDKDESVSKKQSPFEQTMGSREDRKNRQISRLEKKLKRLDNFLSTASIRRGASGEEIQSNITDNESIFIKSSHGYIQGYNGVSVSDSGHQIIVSAEVTACESEIFPEMLDKLNENMKTITGKENPLEGSLIEADTGFFSEKNLKEANNRKIDVLIPDHQFRKRDTTFTEKEEKEENVEKEEKGLKKTKKKDLNVKKFKIEKFKYNTKEDNFVCPNNKVLSYDKTIKLSNRNYKKYVSLKCCCEACSLKDKCLSIGEKKRNRRRELLIKENGEDSKFSEEMKKKIDDPAYRELYSRRMQIVEPVFSDIVYNKRMNRFSLRGKKKVTIQWQLYCIVHNIGKCVGKIKQGHVA